MRWGPLRWWPWWGSDTSGWPTAVSGQAGAGLGKVQQRGQHCSQGLHQVVGCLLGAQDDSALQHAGAALLCEYVQEMVCGLHHAGDSRAVLCREEGTVAMSLDHKATRNDEVVSHFTLMYNTTA
jgi:serine/threonine protein phosphatase PrpC